MTTRSRTSTQVLGALALISSLVVAPAPTRAQDVAPTEEPARVLLRVSPATQTRVERALLSIDSSAPPSFWRALGTEGMAALAVVLDDARRPLALRRRAALALAHYPGATQRALLVALLDDVNEDEIVSRNALTALADSHGAGSIARVTAALRDPRALVREGAVRALATLASQSVLSRDELATRLAAARAQEPELFVREAIDRALAAR